MSGSWKEAQIIPNVKPGKDPTNTTGYRPITSHLQKVIERMAVDRLMNVIGQLFTAVQDGEERHGPSSLLRI